jgi:hypothetical protein
MEQVRSLIKHEFGYEASFSHFPIIGLCARCAREEPLTSDTEERLAC